MKVLFIAPYIYNDRIPGFAINHTGFGLLLNEMVKYISRNEKVYLITNVITKKVKYEGVNIIQHEWKDIFLSCKAMYGISGIIDFIRYDEKLINRIKKIYYSIDNGYIEKVIKVEMPDIVHIHSVSERTKLLIKICKRYDVPFVITLHGLIGLNESIITSKRMKKVEEEFLRRSELENIPVTVVSTGMKKRIIKEYKLAKGNNISVVTNGTYMNTEMNQYVNIYEKHQIPKENKIMLCVGNITINKNQVQVARCYSLLPEFIKGKLTILILGEIRDKRLQDTINELNIGKNVICCGSIDAELVPSYFKQAHYNIVASIYEGFGMSVIEGFVQGIPTVTFSDLDAVPDLYNEKAMIITDDRSDEGLAKAMESLIQIEWDPNFIKEYSKKFSLEIMAENYRKVYKTIINR